MSDISKATPRPWINRNKVGYVYGPDCVVATCGDFKDKTLAKFNADRWNADAALIVRAVNSFDALVAALTRLVADYENVPDATDTDGQAVFEQARAALKGAGA